MKIFLILVFLLLLAIPVSLVVLGVISRAGASPGLKNAKLAPCPSSPNCVCSEFKDDQAHYVAPLHMDDDSTAATRAKLTQIIADMGGRIVNQQDSSAQSADYIVATFHSSLFGFVDDFELRVDAGNKTIQIRSASRVGRSDLGVNHKRVEQFRQRFSSNR